MKLTLTIQMENAAFDDGTSEELHRILLEAASKLQTAQPLHKGQFALLDINGNKVGKVEVK